MDGRRGHAGGHAVVVGASMAGMLAARVLTEHFDRVTVLERDRLPGDPVPRRGVPQSCQPHVVLAGCAQAVEELLPGYLAELVAAGAHRFDDGDLTRYDVCFGGHVLTRTGRLPAPDTLVQHFASRPLLEHHVRRRVGALPGVAILDGHCVDTLLESEDRITGVRVRHPDGSILDLQADLVVDASGRGSRAPALLEALGYPRPPVDELTVRVTYASMPVRMPVDALHQNMVIRMFEPGRPRGTMLVRAERDTWMVLVGTLGGLRPPTDPPRLLDFAEGLAPGYAMAAVRSAEPLGDVKIYQYPSNRWRRYDKVTRYPEGFLAIGDAVCSVNPIYGQGMTLAAAEAMILRDTLRHGDRDLARRFYRAAAKPVRLAWQTAVGSDLALPEVNGRPSLTMRITNAYTDRVLTAAEVDPLAAQEFLRVVGMVASPTILLRPSFMLRVAGANRWRTRAVADAPEVRAAAS